MKTRTRMLRSAMLVVPAMILLGATLGGCPEVGDPNPGRPTPTPPAVRDDHANSASGATRITVGGGAAGNIETAGDVDYFSFSAQQGWSYVIETTGSTDMHLTLLGTNGSLQLANDDDGGQGTNARIEWVAPAAGTYYVAVRHFSPNGTGGYGVAVAGRAPPSSPSATLIMNSDNSSRHIAQATMSDGTRIDYWVEREDDGSVAYLSDIRVRRADSREYYIQFDALQRPTYFRDSTGASVRIHFYLSGNLADVTLTLPNGQSARGIVDLDDLAIANPRARVIRSSLSKEQVTKDDRAWEVRAQSIRNDGGGLCTALEDIRRVACFASTVYSVISFGAAMGACLTSIGAGGGVASILTGITGCAVSHQVGQIVADFLIDELICETSRRLIVDGCSPHERRALGESQPPARPSQTGGVTLGTGSVHVTLSWDKATDVDLHIIDPFGQEIYYSQPRSASGGELDVDDTDGYGPENIFWPQAGAPSGQYVVAVVYYSARGHGSSNYVVTVRYPGADGRQVIREYSGTLSVSGERRTITTFTVGIGGGGGGGGRS